MCTITFFPLTDKKSIITFNRDEDPLRESTAFDKYPGSRRIWRPTDVQSGGTWCGASEHTATSIFLLNGGFEKHVRKKSYKKSRGLLVQRLLVSPDPIRLLSKKINLHDYEPCTIFIFSHFSYLRIRRFVWDGVHLLVKILSSEKPFLYCSATLYDTNQQNMRKEKFLDSISHEDVDTQKILRFHQDKGNGIDEGISIKRIKVQTVSTLQFAIEKYNCDVSYTDYIKNKYNKRRISLL